MGVLELFSASEWLTVGLVIFAGVQILVPHLAERRRISERKADDDRANDVAFQLVWAEHFRLDQLAEMFECEDLVQLAALDVLNSGEVLPRDWSVVMSGLARLSQESGYLGGVALALGHNTATRIAVLNGLVDSFRKQYPDKSPDELVEMVRHNRKKEAEQLQDTIRANTRDLSRLMWDAVRHSPRADVVRNMNFREDMQSKFGQNAARAVAKRGKPVLENTGVFPRRIAEKWRSFISRSRQ